MEREDIDLAGQVAVVTGSGRGLGLAFARALGEFGATILVAGDIPGRTRTLALAIYGHVQLCEDAQAYRLLTISVAVTFAALWSAEWFLRRRERG